MRKQGLARRLARRAGVSPAEAADELDRVVHRIIAGLRNGESVPVPGLGTFRLSETGEFDFEADGGKGGGRGGE